MLDYRRAKVRACDVLTYKADYEFEKRMIAQVQVQPERMCCVGCDEEYQPRFIGDQACQRCRG